MFKKVATKRTSELWEHTDICWLPATYAARLVKLHVQKPHQHWKGPRISIIPIGFPHIRLNPWAIVISKFNHLLTAHILAEPFPMKLREGQLKQHWSYKQVSIKLGVYGFCEEIGMHHHWHAFLADSRGFLWTLCLWKQPHATTATIKASACQHLSSHFFCALLASSLVSVAEFQ